MTTVSKGHFIGGEWLQTAGAEMASENPATGEQIWQGKAADATTVAQAVEAARAAFTEWRLLSFDERKAYVDRFVEQIKARESELAQAIHIETGKPLWESKTEIGTMVGKAAISVSAYEQRTGLSDQDNKGIRVLLAHRPIGAFAVLGPYNFPGHLPNGHIIPALLAGNTVVFKPSELTPWFGELMVECWEAAGLPAGVVNLVQGARETGESLVGSPLINGVLFTGSSKTGHAIHKALAGKPEKMLALEMGGNNPLVVDKVADVDAAVYTILQSAFISAGQRCTCARRLIIVDSEQNRALLQRLADATAALKVGSDDDAFIGPVISNAAADQVMAFASRLQAAGAKDLVACERPDPARPFIRPGIVDVSAAKGVEDEECFGPLLQVTWVADLEAAVAEANNTHYGLSAGLLSDNSEDWDYFYPRIEAGIVNFNRPITGASGAAPFGGIGASGNFRPGAYYAADYSAYPIASMLSDSVTLPETLSPGISLAKG